jgi:putative N6-adenine-specific DNA methylase
MQYELIATTSFGIEAVAAEELRQLGYNDLRVENGKISFTGGIKDIATCNLWLRTADRVQIKLAEFRATDFEELFEGTVQVGWEQFIPLTGKMHVVGKSHTSKLFSVPDCQSIVKKAIVEAMKRKYRADRFEETGPVFKIEVALLNDVAILTLDTSGPGLHKRGYRKDKGEAPIRETLAAAMVRLSRWTPGRDFADPLCGSGTIAIEAGLIGRNRAPGIDRSFVCEAWPDMPGSVWQEAREEARSRVREADFRILASDRDGVVLRTARENAKRAGVSDVISFQRQSAEEFRSGRKFGCIVCNPPYGERIGEAREVEALYQALGGMYGRLDSWSFFALSAHPQFEKLFGRKADRKRKLYNGNILCYLYQYLGPLPRPRSSGPEDKLSVQEKA